MDAQDALDFWMEQNIIPIRFNKMTIKLDHNIEYCNSFNAGYL